MLGCPVIQRIKLESPLLSYWREEKCSTCFHHATTEQEAERTDTSLFQLITRVRCQSSSSPSSPSPTSAASMSLTFTSWSSPYWMAVSMLCSTSSTLRREGDSFSIQSSFCLRLHCLRHSSRPHQADGLCPAHCIVRCAKQKNPSPQIHRLTSLHQ